MVEKPLSPLLGSTSVWLHAAAFEGAPATPRLSLGEAGTPLLPAPGLARELGLEEVWLKDESATSIGTFKARGMAFSVSARAGELPPAFVVASPGNAGIAAASYAALVARPCVVLTAAETAPHRLAAIRAAGGIVVRVDGDSGVASSLADTCVAEVGWGDLTTSAHRDHWHHAGAMTIAWEIEADLPADGRDLVVVACVGGGNLLAGLYDGFNAGAGAMPRFLAAQAAGCAPVVQALQEGRPQPVPWTEPRTVALSIADPVPLDGAEAISAAGQSGGWGAAIDDTRLLAEVELLRELTGIDADESVGAAIAAVRDSRERIGDARVVIVVGARRIAAAPGQPVPDSRRWRASSNCWRRSGRSGGDRAPPDRRGSGSFAPAAIGGGLLFLAGQVGADENGGG